MITSLQRVILYLIHLDRVVWGSKQLHQTAHCWHSQPGTLAEGTQVINFGSANLGDLEVGRRWS